MAFIKCQYTNDYLLTFYHPGFMTIRENQSLKIRFTKRFPGMESSIPVTLIMEHSISQNRSVLPLQGWASV